MGLARGSCRYESVAQALRAFEGEIDLRDLRSLLIKPNFVSVERQLAATHVDAARAVLNFVCARYDNAAIVAEDAAVSSAEYGYCNLDCKSLVGACVSILWISTPMRACLCVSVIVACGLLLST